MKVGQNPTTLQNYLRTMGLTQGKKNSTYPEVLMQKIQLQIGTKESSGLQFDSTLLEKHISRWARFAYLMILFFRLRDLEGECARAASDGIVPIKYKPSYPSMQKGAFTPNNVPSTSYVQEPITLTIPVYNQLLNTLQISDIKVKSIYFSNLLSFKRFFQHHQMNFVLNLNSANS